MTADSGSPAHCRSELYQPSPLAWETVGPRIVELERQAFGDGAFEAQYLEEEFSHGENVVVLLREIATGSILGFTYATPIDLMEEGRDDEWADTAYVGDTVIDAAYRGQGLVGFMMRTLEDQLCRRGYRFLERDAAVRHGYADAIRRAYGDRIIARDGPHPSPWGQQVHFRIALEPRLPSDSLQSVDQ